MTRVPRIRLGTQSHPWSIERFSFDGCGLEENLAGIAVFACWELSMLICLKRLCKRLSARFASNSGAIVCPNPECNQRLEMSA
jgi:hypothetical protein